MVRAIAILLLLGACSHEQLDLTGIRHTPLVNDIPSLSSPDDVARLVGARSSFETIEGSPTVRQNDVFNEYVALVRGYRVNEQTGDLRVTFVNGRLMATWFYPENTERFLEDLKKTGVAFALDDGAMSYDVPGTTTEVRLGRDRNGRQYVAWEDRVIVELVDDWILHNS